MKNNVGVTCGRDDVALNFTYEGETRVVADFRTMDIDELRKKYSLPADSSDWKVEFAKNDVSCHPVSVIKCLYRPMDSRYLAYTGHTKGIVQRPRAVISRNFLARKNLALLLTKQTRDEVGAFVSDTPATRKSFSAYDVTSVFPLYVYPEENDLMGVGARKPNLDPALVEKFAEAVGLRFTEEKDETPGTFAPIDILGYIYAVLYSPSYRERYNSFLKTDFPRVPYPESAEEFRRLAALGARLVAVHLLESDELDDPPATYPVEGDHRVEAPAFRDGRIYINKTQYFGNATERSWNFPIGGYQPAQKWLKDRRGRTLSPADILHYERILRALDLTAELMGEIDAGAAPGEKVEKLKG